MGLATVVDLRTPRELERTGRGPLGPEPVAYQHLSVIGDAGGEATEAGEGRPWPRPADDDLSARYLWYLEVGGAGPGRGPGPSRRAGQLPPGLPLRGGQGPDRGAGRPGARHPGRGPRGHRGRLPDHRGPDGADPRAGTGSDPAFEARMARCRPRGSAWRPPPWSASSTSSHRRFGGAEGWADGLRRPAGGARTDAGRCSSRPAWLTRSPARPGARRRTPAGPGLALHWGRECFDLGAAAGRDGHVPRPDAGRPGPSPASWSGGWPGASGGPSTPTAR